MANFICYENQDNNIIERFSTISNNARGIDIWKKYTTMLVDYLKAGEQDKVRIRKRILNEIRPGWDLDTKMSLKRIDEAYNFPDKTERVVVTRLLRELRSIEPDRNRCPRLFISHRQVDWIYALQMGKLAGASKFDYWIDILDDRLIEETRKTGLSKECRMILTAGIIEMAIINCTHVLVCMTPATYGSQWVPYEYGRITGIPNYHKKAASWTHPKLPNRHFPDYMHLGEVVNTQKEISNWLKIEYSFWSKPTCPVSADLLSNMELPPIPETKKDCTYEPYYLYIYKGDKPQKLLIKPKTKQTQLKKFLNKNRISDIDKIEKMSESEHKRLEFKIMMENGIPIDKPVKNGTRRSPVPRSKLP